MQTGGRNRAAIVGVGGWGARVVAHLWPRLRMADRGRALTPASPLGMAFGMSGALTTGSMRLPRLSDMVSHALVLPGEDGSITVARPRPERWDDVSFARRRLPYPDGGSDGDMPSAQQSVRTLRSMTHRALWPTLDIVGRYELPKKPEQLPSRQEMWHYFQDHRLDIATDIAAIVELARVDESTPDEEASQLTLFVVASLADELASAILWPLTQILRERVGGHVLAELVGLLSTGVYAPPLERRREEAAVHVAISELAQLTGPVGANGSHAPGLFAEQILGVPAEEIAGPPFDRTYLIDREKTSGALVRDESELTTVVGNALEAFLAADANIYLRNALAPDAADLLRVGPYSSLGAACIYVPLEEMWTQARQRLALDMLRDHFLAPLPDEVAQQVGELADRFDQTELDAVHLSGRLLARGIVEAGPANQDSAGLPALQVKTPVTPAPRSDASVPLREQPSAPDTPAPRLRHGHLRRNAVQVSPAGARSDASAAMGDTFASLSTGLAAQAGAINSRFDAVEAGQLAEWAATLAENSATLAANGGNAADSNGQRSLLQRLDDEIMALVTTHDQGLAAASAYLARIVHRLRDRQEAMTQQQQRWQRLAESDEAMLLQQRLASLDDNRLLSRLPSWPATLGGLSLLALAISALVMLNSETAANVVLGWSLAIATGVFVAGVVAWLAYRQWLYGSLARVTALRQARLNQLAQVHLAGALAGLFSQLMGDIARRQQALEIALDRLQRDRDALADRISEPLALSRSFVRQPLAQEELYADIRSQPAHLPAEDLATQVFRADAVSMEMIRQGWKHSVRHPESAAGTVSSIPALPHGSPAGVRAGASNGAMPPGALRESVAEAMSLAIERYAARLSQPEAPTDVNVEDLLPKIVPEYNASDFLANLRVKAKPLIHLDDQMVTAPISIDLMASPYAAALQPASPVNHAAALRLRLLSSYDPFSLILVRTLHGVPLEAIGSLRAYAESFAALPADERAALLLAASQPEKSAAGTRRRSSTRRKATAS